MADKQSGIAGAVGRMLQKLFQLEHPSGQQSTEMKPVSGTNSDWALQAYRMMGGSSGLTGDENRSQKYDKYKMLDRNLAEACAALNVYADNLVSGTIGGEENFYVEIDEDTPEIEKLEEIVTEAEKKSKIKDLIWDLGRDFIRDGDVFAEPIIVQNSTEGYYIDRLKFLPIKEMEADVNEFGSFRDSEHPYIQRIPNVTQTIPFEWWRVIHFKMGNGIYGVDKSLFASAALRVGKQLIWVDEALVVARLSRAWKRYAYLIDTKGLTPEDAMVYVEKFMTRMHTKQVISDSTKGRTDLLEAPPMPDEDIGIPSGEGSKADVKELGGDSNISNIADIAYLQNKFLTAVTVPKAYVSMEEGVNARATMGYIDVQFARQVRRRQQALIPGLKKFYELVFTLAGIDHTSFKWEIIFPEMATSDEMQKWTMLKLKADIASILDIQTGLVNDDYVYKELLDWDDDMIKKYALNPGDNPPPDQNYPPVQYGPDGQPLPPDQQTLPGNTPSGNAKVQLPPEVAMMMRRDPYVRQMLDDMKDIVAWKIGREERLKGMKAIGVKRNIPLRDKRIR